MAKDKKIPHDDPLAHPAEPDPQVRLECRRRHHGEPCKRYPPDLLACLDPQAATEHPDVWELPDWMIPVGLCVMTLLGLCLVVMVKVLSRIP